MSAALVVQPRRQRRAEVDGRDRRAAVPTGHSALSTVPLWVKDHVRAALTLGTAMGGWRIVRTIGRRIFRLREARRTREPEGLDRRHPLLVLRRAPVSTTQVVASSVIGVGGGRQSLAPRPLGGRPRDGGAWLLTIPATAASAHDVVIWNADSHERAPLVPPRHARRPGMLREQTAITVGGDGRPRRLGHAARPRGQTVCATASTARTSASATCERR